MERADSLLQLKQAGELTFMLEQMASSFARSQSTDSGQVWGGVCLTLRQIGKSIERVQDELSSRTGFLVDPPSNPRPAVSDTPPNGSTSLAGRVQKAPTSSGRVRELVDHQTGDLAHAGSSDY